MLVEFHDQLPEGESRERMRTVYTLIIPDPGRTKLLAVRRAQQWALPELTFAQRSFWQVVSQINTAVRDQFGLEVTTLRCRSIMPTAGGHEMQLVYELELRGSSESLAVEGRWIGPDAVDELPPTQRPLLTQWRAEAGAGQPTSRVPWYRPGWRDKMLSWISTTLEQDGRSLTGPVEQVRAWERSALWRAPTDHGFVYFKAVPPIFGHEPVLTAQLAERFPACIPQVLALDADRGWLLMGDAGTQSLISHPEIERWEAALRAYARMQIELSRHTNKLRTAGVPHRGPAWLRAGLRQLHVNSDSLGGAAAGLKPDEIAALRQLEPELQAACVRWEQSGLPLSLEHGDFSAWQVQLDDGSNRFLDWSDSSIAPPFFSMLGVFRDVPAQILAVPDARGRLRDAYLEGWAELVSPDTAREAFDIAQRLAPLHHALIYAVDILPSMEQRWELAPMAPFYLRMLLNMDLGD